MERLPSSRIAQKHNAKDSHKHTWNDPEHVGKFMLLFMYMFLMVGFAASILYFIYMVRIDVDYRLQQRNIQNIYNYEQCKRLYDENECSPESRVPALEALCEKWLSCAKEASIDIGSVNNSAKLWAQTVGEVINEFMDTITLRSLVFILLILSASISLMRYSYGSYQVYYYGKEHLD
ncbi:hypothetical protein TPHA_0G03660 [Tetrapisispora phaffii CBS 4417]|uniref:Brl1/Brr6 domain-containing protein n=1 Tax=Tetrapisispora phaffii (strain ATCC 24235 / CBS 4417 / NBRC 1672 / NRRL Y-8282 / UCD 70-5) TaxID=1071381 RepID=G8BWC8_TETPH|nr:hypothetical protein TPHA_0G03660 [Tetrapisispora phaffii CBS 4417]CCE64206.1 hypothetical protein TPHA_0G03660 [Tetrapisispora phaffii CBS 4417]